MITGEKMVEIFWGEKPEGGQDDIDAMEVVRTAVIKDVLFQLYHSAGTFEGTPNQIHYHLMDYYGIRY